MELQIYFHTLKQSKIIEKLKDQIMNHMKISWHPDFLF